MGGPILGGRYFFVGRPWNNGGNDYADAPAGSGFTIAIPYPMLEIQYLTDARGWNILQSGDSIAAAPANDNFSNGVYRACKLLSTPQAPCEWSSVAWGGTSSAVYDESLRNNALALQPSAIVQQAVSRNDVSPALRNLQMLLAKSESYAGKLDARLGFYGAFPLTTTLDGSTTWQANVATMRARLAAISKTCQPNTGGQTCPTVPVLDPGPIVSRAALGGNAWQYLGLGMIANGAAAAGATSITVSVGTTSCYVGDILTDLTTPGAVLSGATVTSATATTVSVASTAIIGAGILSGDNLVCSMPGWTGGALTYDNTHPWYPAWVLLQPASNTFVQQLLGLQ